jgi:hypothetical protein
LFLKDQTFGSGLKILDVWVFLNEYIKKRSWLRHYATSWKVAGSIPNRVIGFFNDLIVPAALCPWGRFNL